MTYSMSRNIRMVQAAVSHAYLHSVEFDPISVGSIRKKGGDPEIPPVLFFWWAVLESNQQPTD